MAFRLMRAYLARGTVVAAAFAVPLLASASAQAALGGASPEKTSNRPDLVSATLLSGGSVDYCFDKTIANAALVGTNFELGGYRSVNVFPANGGAALETAIPSTPADSCVRANFTSAAGDLNQYTIATVLKNAVVANGGTPIADGNSFTDSVQLTGSNTHNGTSGFTIAPDLTGVIPDSTSNTITYTEDQAIGSAGAATLFYFVDAGGNVCTGAGTPAVSGNTVAVLFAGDTCTSGTSESVTNAVRAGQLKGAVVAANDPTAGNAHNEAVVPNPPNAAGATTAKPDLTDVKMESDQSALDFTFDKTVAPAVGGTGNFFAELSTGDEVPATGVAIIATSTTSTTIRATFPNFGTYDEYVVGGSVTGNGKTTGAVLQSGTTTSFNTPGALPLDAPFGNAGALATGFTTAPDVLGAVGSTGTGVVSVLVDQRAFASVPADIQLLDGTGNEIVAAPAGSVFLPPQAAGQQLIKVQFLPGQLTTAKNLALLVGALTNPLSTEATGSAPAAVDQASVPQVLSMTTTSSILHSATLHKTQSRAWLARRDARLQAASKARLARMRKLAAKQHSHHKVKHNRA